MTDFSFSSDGRTVLRDGQPMKRARSVSEAVKIMRTLDPAEAERVGAAGLVGPKPVAAVVEAVAISAPEPAVAGLNAVVEPAGTASAVPLTTTAVAEKEASLETLATQAFTTTE